MVFEKSLTAAQVKDGIAYGRHTHLKAQKERQRRMRLADLKETFHALRVWCQSRNELHRLMVWDVVQEHLETATAVARLRLESWLGTDPITVEEVSVL